MFLFLILFFLLLPPSFAKEEELDHSGHTIYLNNKDNWELGKNLFGIPFTFFSPKNNGQRSNVTFYHTGIDLDLKVSDLKENQKDYLENKKKWARNIQAQIRDFIPYKSYLNSHGHRVHSIGVSYSFKEKTYFERSFYIECKGSLLFSKGLVLKENKEHEEYIDTLINSLDCGVL